MIRAAIIGLGRWGRNLVNSVQGKSDAIHFVAGALRDVAKARDFAVEKGFPLYDSYEKALADPRVDAVVLATPHTLHAQQIVAAAKAGRHVFTEKPLALTARSAAAALRACAKARSHARGGLQLALPARAPGNPQDGGGRPPREAAAPGGQFLRTERLPLPGRSLAPGA